MRLPEYCLFAVELWMVLRRSNYFHIVPPKYPGDLHPVIVNRAPPIVLQNVATRTEYGSVRNLGESMNDFYNLQKPSIIITTVVTANGL